MGDADFEIVEDLFKDGSKSLKIKLLQHLYSGVELQYFPNNWSGYEYLFVHVFIPQPNPMLLNVSVFDGQHHHNRYLSGDKYNNRFLLNNGWNEIKIPLANIIKSPKKRQIDIADIRGLRLFVK